MFLGICVGLIDISPNNLFKYIELMSITSSTFGKRTYKIVLLGDSSTGKTSIIDRFVNNKFEEKDNPTIGIDFLGKNITHQSTTCRLQLWDTAGQERYRSLIPSYLKDAVCALFVFDLTREQTLKNLNSWIDLFRDNRNERAVMVICGNKSDLLSEGDKGDLEDKVKQVAQNNKMKYFQTSALTGDNVEKMFFTIIEDVIELQQTKKKQIIQQDLTGPQTYQNLASARNQNLDPEPQSQKPTIDLNTKPEQSRKYCCL